MAILEPEGLFGGDRLAALSDKARVYWPWLYTASNSFARLELNCRNIISRCFPAWANKPSEQQIMLFIREYADNFLLFVYSRNGQEWVQFDTPAKCLPTFHTKRDKASPAPTPQEIDAFNAGLALWRNKRNPQICPNPGLFEDFKKSPHGIEVGKGEGKGIKTIAPASSEAAPKVEILTPKPKSSDNRHALFKAEIGVYWARHNQHEMPWDGSEARQLSTLLSAIPKTTVEDFRVWLSNRSNSDANHSERVRSWIAKASDYAGGSLDVYGKPKSLKGGKNGNIAASKPIFEGFVNGGRAETPSRGQLPVRSMPALGPPAAR